jgi:hypothetical protein
MYVINLLNNVTMTRHLRNFGVKIQNYVHEEINSRLISGNACQHSVYNSYGPISCLKQFKIKRFFYSLFPLSYGCPA